MCCFKKCSIHIVGSIVGFLILSVSFLLMPVDSNDAQGKIGVISLLSGIMFYLGLIIGIVMQISASVSCKKVIKKSGIKEKIEGQPKIGLISFFQNKLAKIFDVLKAISLIGLIVVISFITSTGYICYVLIATLVFSFFMHCIFNGKNYFYVSNEEKIKEMQQKSHDKELGKKRKKK